MKTLALLARHWLRRGIRRTDAIGAELRRIDPMITRAEPTGTPPTLTHHPVTRHLAAALDGFPDLDALAEHGPHLPWHHGDTPHPSRPGLEHRLARAELIGPHAPLTHPALRLGFLLIAPHTDYPPHTRAAVELCHVISGRALWTAAGTVTERRPGDFILHPSGIPRAMTTTDEPVLAIYTRTGDITAPSRFLP